MFSKFPHISQRFLRPMKVEALSPAARLLSIPLPRQAPVNRRSPALMLQAMNFNNTNSKKEKSKNAKFRKMPVTVTASLTLSTDGQSGKPDETSELLKKHAATFWVNLEALEKKRGEDAKSLGTGGETQPETEHLWSVFNCAEPNAIAKFLAERPSVSLAHIVLSPALRGLSQELEPCRNCEHWLESVGGGNYKIKSSYLTQSQPQSTPTNKTSEDFPPLGSRK